MNDSLIFEAKIKYKSMILFYVYKFLSKFWIKKNPEKVFEYSLIINGAHYFYKTILNNKVDDKYQFCLLAKRVGEAKVIKLIKDDELHNKVNGILIDKKFYYPVFCDLAYFSLTNHQIKLLESYLVPQAYLNYTDMEKENLVVRFSTTLKNSKDINPFEKPSNLWSFWIFGILIIPAWLLSNLFPILSVLLLFLPLALYFVNNYIEQSFHKKFMKKYEGQIISLMYKTFEVEYLNYHDYFSPPMNYTYFDKINEYNFSSNVLYPQTRYFSHNFTLEE